MSQPAANALTINAATRALYERLRGSPPHGPFLERIQSVDAWSPPRLEATVVIVPGAFHRSHHDTGADGRLVCEEARRMGVPTEIIPLPNFGFLQYNAQVITDWLRQYSGAPIILVSVSKGGPDLKVALARADAGEAFRNVVAWVNISGLLDGTPLANWLFSGTVRSYWTRLLLWTRRYDADVIHELERRPGGPLDFPITLPVDLKLIHVIGFPSQADLSNSFARRCHRRIAHLGPNDGMGIILADVLQWPGLVYPVLGADHYLRPAGRDMRTVVRQILSYLAQELQVEAVV